MFVRPHRGCCESEQGYILLILGLFVTLLALSLLAVAPRVAQQIQRDREDEMIHRGAQYARAIRKFVKKNGTFPTSLDQLENTNNVRFLRRRYKDPMSPEGNWKLLHIGDVPFLATGQAASAAGQTGATNAGTQGSLFQSGPLSQPGSQPADSPSGATDSAAVSMSRSSLGMGPLTGSTTPTPDMPGSASAGSTAAPLLPTSPGAGGAAAGSRTPASSSGGAAGSASSSSPSSSGSPSLPPQSSTSQAASTRSSGPVFGAGAIIGVASTSEGVGLHEFNKKTKYKEWYFIYDPTAEAANPNGGGLITGPYTGKTFSATSQVGTPAQQLASPNQPSGFGQPIGTGFGGTTPSTPPPQQPSKQSQP